LTDPDEEKNMSEDPPFTVFWLIRKSPNLSREQYISHYETKHRLFGERIAAGKALSYVRHHLHPLTSTSTVPSYDTVTEMRFPNRQAFDEMMASLASNKELLDAVVEDEKRLIDREALQCFVVHTVTS
jgi:hypothetical protein